MICIKEIERPGLDGAPHSGARVSAYEHFAAGKISAQGEFISPEHFKSERVPMGGHAAHGMAAKERYAHLMKLIDLYKAE